MRRATARATSGELADPRVDDRWVETAQRLVMSLDAPTQNSLPEAVRAAYDLSRASELPRQLLEAQLLTPRTHAEVASVCSLPEDVVEAFHELFFDVRPKLRYRDWIQHWAIGGAIPLASGREGEQRAWLWKSLAYNAGHHILDRVVAVMLNRPLPDRLRTSFRTSPVLEERRLRLKTKLFVAARTAEIESHARASLTRFGPVPTTIDELYTMLDSAPANKRLASPVPEDDSVSWEKLGLSATGDDTGSRDQQAQNKPKRSTRRPKSQATAAVKTSATRLGIYSLEALEADAQALQTETLKFNKDRQTARLSASVWDCLAG
ncbi:MAG: hypothetical protein K8U57_19080 [Planctomycetes bacterium]|nr:hypothetical protein [Planctomycetota bacterium]